MVRSMDWQGEVLIWCRKCSGSARQRMGPNIDELLQAGASGHKKYGKETNPDSRRRQGPCQGGKKLED